MTHPMLLREAQIFPTTNSPKYIEWGFTVQ